LEHQNIVQYLGMEINSKKNKVNLILEYVPGGSIRELLDKFEAFDEKLVKLYTR
jgi:mitogen-activated protein kinase kinase kinase